MGICVLKLSFPLCLSVSDKWRIFHSEGCTVFQKIDEVWHNIVPEDRIFFVKANDEYTVPPQ